MCDYDNTEGRPSRSSIANQHRKPYVKCLETCAIAQEVEHASGKCCGRAQYDELAPNTNYSRVVAGK